jgi:LuxR family transcriptional regulator, maltose regulon positive regulatory protein
MGSVIRIKRTLHPRPSGVSPLKNIAKLNRPRTENVLSRDRLFAKLDQAKSAPVIWIAAPGGAGKTTLASSYIDHCRLSHLWYQLDASDADPASFFYYLRMAVEQFAVRRRRKLPMLTPQFLPGLPNFSRTFFSGLYDLLPSPALIVLDDYHHLAAEDPLHEVLLAALDRIPEEITFLILSRNAPPPIFARLRASRKMALLTGEDLRLTPAECLEIVALEGKEHDFFDFESVCKQIEGWAAGLRLIMEAAALDMEDPGNLAGSSKQMIFDYFTHEIFLRLPEELQRFLIKTSFLPQMSVKMARELTDYPQTETILLSLVRNNQFTERSTGDLYRYHPLFLAFLQDKAGQLLSEEETAGLKKRAVAILLAMGMTEDAATLSVRSADWQSLSQIICQQAAILMEQGRSQTLEGWISALPGEILDSSPWVQFWMGNCRLFFNQAAGREWLVRAYEGFKKQGDCAGAYLAWAGVIESYIHEWDLISPLDYWIAEMDGLRRRFPDLPSPEVKMRVTGSMFAALIYRQPDHPDLDHWMQQAEELALSATDLPQRLLIGCNLFLYHLWNGNVAKQGFILNALRGLPLQQQQLAHAPYLIMLNCLELFHSIFAGATEQEIIRKNDNIERLATESGFHLFDHKLFFGKIYYYILAGQYPRLAELLDQLAVSLERQTLEKNHLYLLQAWHAWTVLGDSGQALEYLKITLRMAEETGSWYFNALSQIGYGHLYTVIGDYDQAALHLGQLKQCSEKCRNQLLLYHYLVFSANLAFAREEEKQGIAFLRQALSLARERGLLATLNWWQPDMMADLCCRALEADIETEYARHLIRKFNLQPVSPPIGMERWPWPLKIYTLGGMKIEHGEKILQLSGRSQQKAILLLSYLLALGGENINEEHLAELMWPGVDGDLQHQNFRTTLHRLRRFLMVPEAIFYQEGKLTINSRVCWVDAWAFEKLAGLPAAGINKNAATHALHRAVSLYKGTFMALEESSSLCCGLQDKFHNLFLDSVKRLSECHRQEKRLREAIDVYWSGLRIDPLIEQFYQGIIACHLEAGNPAEAVRVYKCCRERMAKFLGMDPSPATAALIASITTLADFNTPGPDQGC